ncbi:MAG: hypothetical protein P8183_12725 [Anaerolineae bacterium]|jgi:Tol biopolymer transport system component
MWHRMLISVLFLMVGSISACGLNQISKPPDGFIDLNDITQPEQFLKMPALSNDGQFIAALGGISQEEPSIEQLIIIDIADQKVIFSTEDEFWVSLAISSDGKKVAACKNQQIFLIDLDTRKTSYLTDGCWPTWSPDGQRLAFVLITPDNKQIRVRDLATGIDEVVYESTSTFIGYLDWSPKQDKIAFSMHVNSNLLKLHTINIDGSGFIKLTNSPHSVVSPKFSPEGDKILYVDWNAPLDAGTYLQIVDLEGYCHRIESPVSGLRYISLSPDGNTIAFGTIHGLLISNTEVALGKNFWTNGEPCTDS